MDLFEAINKTLSKIKKADKLRGKKIGDSFLNKYYWSSSETGVRLEGENQSSIISPHRGAYTKYDHYKDDEYYVRPIKYFTLEH